MSARRGRLRRRSPAAAPSPGLLGRVSVRTRLALLYGGVTVAAGAGLIWLMYALVDNATQPRVAAIVQGGVAQLSGTAAAIGDPGSAQFAATTNGCVVAWQGSPAPHPPLVTTGPLPSGANPCQNLALARSLADATSGALLHEVLTYSVISLAALAVLAVVIGWWMAGRALRPVHRMTARARRISSQNLDERLGLDGPSDELKELADTFDALLDRLHRAFDGQRRFVANAAHELRTPLAIQRASIQIGLATLPADADELAGIREELLGANRRSERLIDGLLALARSDGAAQPHEAVDLASVVREAAGLLAPEARERRVTVTVDAAPARVVGDPVLLGRLAVNLVQNGIRHNFPGGSVEIRTRGGCLVVRNTGPMVPAERVPDLFEPFRRLSRDRTGGHEGAGLGLSIVRSIVDAHGGTIALEPGAGGGLTARVTLRPAPPSPPRGADLPRGIGGAEPRESAPHGPEPQDGEGVPLPDEAAAVPLYE